MSETGFDKSLLPGTQFQWIDDPLEDEGQDELSRGSFAALVADALIAKNDRKATIVGLTGCWGSGKSTVANFAIERLRDKAHIIVFEPWMVNTVEALAREFFKEIGKAIGSKDDEKARALRTKFYTYAGQCLAALAVATDALETVGVPYSKKLSWGFRKGKDAADTAAKGLEALSNQKTLRDLRIELADALRSIEKPVIVLIDDIDRLTANEVRTVFQLIKACADFPNLRYLIPYDPGQVYFSLEDTIKDPPAFLEKIISHPLDLPAAASQQRVKMVENAINCLGIPDLEGKPLERLQQVFDQVLVPGLTTVRHVKRYFGTVAALLPGVVKDGNWNIDIADFLALEFVRQTLPSLYAAIREEDAPNPGGLVERLANHKEWSAQQKKVRQDMLDSAPDKRVADLCKHALEVLADDVYESSGTERDWSAQHHSDRRFASALYRPVYLGFSEARASVSESRWQMFLNAVSNEQPLDWLFDEWKDQGQLGDWIQIITDRTRDIPRHKLHRLLVEVFRWCENQPRRSSGFLDRRASWTDAAYLITMACLVLLSREQKDDAVGLLKGAIEESKALAAPAYLIGLEIGSVRSDKYCRWAAPEHVEQLAEQLESQLDEKVEDGSIWEVPDPYNWINSWAHLVSESEWKAWLVLRETDRNHALNYFNYYLGSEHDLTDRPSWSSEKNQPLDEMASSLTDDELTEDGRWARDWFLRSKGINRGRQ